MYRRILVPVDGSATSGRGLDEAITLARLAGAEIRLVHVLDAAGIAAGLEFHSGDVMGLMKEAGAKILAEAKARVEAAGLPTSVFLSDNVGRPCDAVVAEATRWNADLIAIGTHGRRGVGRMLLGSDAEQILRLAPVPVLLVRG